MLAVAIVALRRLPRRKYLKPRFDLAWRLRKRVVQEKTVVLRSPEVRRMKDKETNELRMRTAWRLKPIFPFSRTNFIEEREKFVRL